MCGIVGLVRPGTGPNSLPSGRFAAAMDSLRHRGPDAAGEYSDSDVWLGHLRLSIIDLSAAGNQPMRSGDGRFVISYNGEVYNYKELAKVHQLRDLRSSSDSEVVLRLFQKLGIESFVQLNGMYAFAVYDSRDRKLWLVRDRLGVKPLYYRLDKDSLTFASELKGILSLNPEPAICEPAALHEWLYYGTPLGERTLYRGIRQLLPGHYLEIDLASFESRTRAYWTLEQHAGDGTRTSPGGTDIVDRTRHLLEQAVERQLVGDVPVGVFLSGGIDSSAIVAFASRHYGRLNTYSAGFDFAPDGGELPKARRVAALFGTRHEEVHIAGQDVGELIEKMVHHHDMPFSDAANIPLYLLASQVNRHAKVVLQGDGGDELFGGYRRYSTLAYHELLRRVALIVGHADRGALRSRRHQRVRRYLNAFSAQDIATTMARLLTLENDASGPAAVFSPDLRAAVEASNPFARFHECSGMFEGQDIGNRMSLVDLMIVLPDTYLEKVDRSTMAASLEVRVPFLDNELVDFVIRLPGREKMPRGRKKWLLKKALDGIVPKDILYGPKHGLTVPIRQWLLGPLKPMFFDRLDEFERATPEVLDSKRIRQMFEQTISGRKDHAWMLWKVLNFMVWVEAKRIEFRGSGVSG